MGVGVGVGVGVGEWVRALQGVLSVEGFTVGVARRDHPRLLTYTPKGGAEMEMEVLWVRGI